MKKAGLVSVQTAVVSTLPVKPFVLALSTIENELNLHMNRINVSCMKFLLGECVYQIWTMSDRSQKLLYTHLSKLKSHITKKKNTSATHYLETTVLNHIFVLYMERIAVSLSKTCTLKHLSNLKFAFLEDYKWAANFCLFVCLLESSVDAPKA